MDENAQKQPLEPYRPLTVQAIAIGGALMVLVAGIAAFALIYFYGGGSPRDQIGLDIVRTAGALVAGTGGLFALLLAARRQRSIELTLEQQRLTLENQRATLEHQREVAEETKRNFIEQRIIELYTRAVDQLGNDRAPVRLGALHALERLAQNNPSQRQIVVNVICAYLRVPYIPPGDDPLSEDTPIAIHAQHEQRRQELQVRLTAQRILSTHLERHAEKNFWHDIDLDLTGAQLHRFNLYRCHIKNAEFSGVQFSGDANFIGAKFSGNAKFIGVKFSGEAKFAAAEFSGIADSTQRNSPETQTS